MEKTEEGSRSEMSWMHRLDLLLGKKVGRVNCDADGLADVIQTGMGLLKKTWRTKTRSWETAPLFSIVQIRQPVIVPGSLLKLMISTPWKKSICIIGSAMCRRHKKEEI